MAFHHVRVLDLKRNCHVIRGRALEVSRLYVVRLPSLQRVPLSGLGQIQLEIVPILVDLQALVDQRLVLRIQRAHVGQVELAGVVTRDIEPVVGICRRHKVARVDVPISLALDVERRLEISSQKISVLSVGCDVVEIEVVGRVDESSAEAMLPHEEGT